MNIIPAIDLIGGHCVRLSQGDYAQQTRYSTDPVAVAESFEAAGLQHLHLVDLDGARAGKPQNLSVLKQICLRTALDVDFSGGLRSEQDVQMALDCGARAVTIGSLAVKAPDKMAHILAKWGAGKVILGADIKDGKIAISGWEETALLDWHPFLTRWSEAGIEEVMVTDISRDGMLSGPGIALYRQLREAFPALRLIASGGVARMADLDELAQLGMAGAIVGKALYEGRIDLAELGARC